MQKPFTTTLKNGLRVILLENHAAPVVSLNLWANVGSVNEIDSEAGICHLIEHMIFKGTGRRPVGQIAKEVEAAGGDMNAYTSFDETVFYINMSAKRLDVGLDILADAACDPTFDSEELTREKEVVVEEISRAEDNPSQMVSEDLFLKAYSSHPYGRPIAGNRDTVRAISRRYLLEFYKRWYVGSNLIFIVVGDFDREETLRKIDALFSRIPSGTPPQQNIPAEPEQTGPRMITRSMDVKGRYLDIAFPIPNFTHVDSPALDLLSIILGGGASSRLETSLKEEKGLVTAISSSAYTPRHPGLLFVGAVLKEKALRETIASIWEEIGKMREEPPSAREFARARENLRASRVYERQTVEAMARKLGFYQGIANNLGFEEEYYRRLAGLTEEDIREAAGKYLLPQRMTLSFCHSREDNWNQEDIRSWMPSGGRRGSQKKSRTKAPVSDIRPFRLPGGIKLLIRENHHLPLISIRSVSLGGVRNETRKNNGISHLISLLIAKGTHHRTAREIAEEVENLSGHLDGYVGRNLTGLHASFLSEKMTEGIDLFFDLLLNPSFPEDEIRKEKGHTYTAMRNEEDSLTHVVTKRFLEALYPRHPYGLPVLGTRPSVAPLKRKDLFHFYQEIVRPDNLVLSVVGDVDTQDFCRRIREKLSGWKTPRTRTTPPPLPKAPEKPLKIVTKKKKLQAHIVYGFLGTTLNDPDRYPLEVLNSVLAGQGGRLFLELRDKQGLAYAISSSTYEGIEPGYFSVYMGTDPAKLETATAGIHGELEKIRKDLVFEEELERAKRFIIGAYELDLQRFDTVAGLMGTNEIYKIGRKEIFQYPQKIEAVTRQAILRVARKYIRPEASVLSVIKP